MWVINELQDFDIAFKCGNAKQKATSCPKGLDNMFLLLPHVYKIFQHKLQWTGLLIQGGCVLNQKIR